MRLYVQQSMFSGELSTPCLADLNVAAVEGSWSIGLRVTNLSTLEPIAITALPGQKPIKSRQVAHEALDELLNVLEEVSKSGPF